MKNELTQPQRDEIVRRSKAGEKQSDLAVEFEVSETTIKRLITPRLTQSERDEIVRRLVENEKQSDLAVEFGVSQSTINRVRTQEREKTKAEDRVDDSAKELQEQYWATYKKLRDLIGDRHNFLNTDLMSLTGLIERWDALAQRTSGKYSEVYKQRADNYRQELALRNDKDAFNRDLLALVTELKRLSDILISVRGVGVGNPQI